MLGDISVFFKEYWRKKPYYVPGGCVDLTETYGVEQYLADLVATQSAPYLTLAVRDGKQVATNHPTAEDLRAAIQAGGVSFIKTSRTWHDSMPSSWAWMRDIFGRLCRAVAMMYMTPPRSEDVDLFLAGPQSSLGTHFDSVDVFTIQLFGERKWLVEEKTQLDSVMKVARGPDWYPDRKIGFQGPTREVILRPGDAFYVPAYTVHRVTGVSWSVSLALGLKAPNEIDFAEHLLEGARLTRYMNYPPVTWVPEFVGEEHAAAKLELLRRLRALLVEVEGMAVASLMVPLKLPETLAGIDQVPPGNGAQ